MYGGMAVPTTLQMDYLYELIRRMGAVAPQNRRGTNRTYLNVIMTGLRGITQFADELTSRTSNCETSADNLGPVGRVTKIRSVE